VYIIAFWAFGVNRNNVAKKQQKNVAKKQQKI